MGTSRDTYLVWGWKLDYDKLEALPSEKQDEIYDREAKVGQVSTIVDGMGGEYIVVGDVVACLDEYGEGLDFIDFSRLNPPEVKRDEMYDAVKALEPQPGEPSFLLFNHWH